MFLFRNIKEIQESSAQRLQQLESNHEVALQKYHQQVQTLESQVGVLERQLREKNTTLQSKYFNKNFI